MATMPFLRLRFQGPPIGILHSAMTSLPSFVELMASLGLENSADPNDMQSLSRHSRTSSYSSTSSTHSQSSSNYSQALECYRHRSPSIVISSSSPTIAEMEPEKRRHRARFSPYSPAISHIRRGSLPSVAQLGEAESRPSRALSTSPRSMSPQRIVGKQRSSTFGSSSARRPAKLTLDADLVANTPISTFLRRKTPQSSPISPTFPHRFKRSSSPSLPVSIPTLPTFFFPPVTIIPSLSSDTDDDMMSDTSSTRVEAPRKRRKPRVGRHRSSSGLSDTDPASDRDGQNYHRHRISPLP